MTKAIRWSQQQLDDYANRGKVQAPAPAAPPAKPGKYRNRKVDLDGETFDSAKEARRWRVLKLQAAGGHISDLKRQVPFVLAPGVHLKGEARAKPALRYVADATYIEAGQLVVEDTKSTPTRKTDAYRIKKHLMATVLGIHIKEV